MFFPNFDGLFALHEAIVVFFLCEINCSLIQQECHTSGINSDGFVVGQGSFGGLNGTNIGAQDVVFAHIHSHLLQTLNEFGGCSTYHIDGIDDLF